MTINPMQLAKLRKRLAKTPDLRVFQNRRLLRCPVSLDEAPAPIIADATCDVQLRGPANIFGTPVTDEMLHGVGDGNLRLPGVRIYRIPDARPIGNNVVLGPGDILYAPAPVSSEQGIAALARRNQKNLEGYAIEADGDGYQIVTSDSAAIARFPLNAIYFHSHEPGNYGSFLLRQLPQVLRARKEGLAADCYLVPSRTTWFREIAALAGLPDKPVFELREVSGARFESIVMMSNVYAEGAFSQDGTALLRELAQPAKCAPARVYVSRSLSANWRPKYRVLANERRVEDLAGQMGFTVIFPETLSLAQQIRVFSGATHIVGPSGSGMLNAIFARPGARVLDMEIYATTVRQHAKAYATTGKDYAFAFGQPDEKDTSPLVKRRWHLEDKVVREALAWIDS